MSNDEKTIRPEKPRPSWQDNPRSGTASPDGRSSSGAPPPRTGASDNKYESGTIVLGGQGQAQKGATSDGNATVVFDSKRLPVDPTGRMESALQQPTVGWLVIVAGPGVGNIFALNYGHNSLGRGAGAKIQLSFGDTQISEKISLYVSYDGMARKFYARAGEGQSMAYVNKASVMGVCDLPANAEIMIGATKMRFVPLCGPDFDWQSAVETPA